MQQRILVTIMVLAAAGATFADQGRTEIGPTDTFPIVIDTPGSYVLTADLHVVANGVNGIEIQADNVSLDLGGHLIRGPGVSAAEGIGVHAVGPTGIAVFNGTVTEFAEGINVQGIGGTYGTKRLYDLTVSFCGQSGISMSGGTARDITVHDSAKLSQGRTGFSCGHCAVSNISAHSNLSGIRVFRGTAVNLISEDNLNSGITLVKSSLTGGSSTGNGIHGVHAQNTSVISGVVATGNIGWGFMLDSGNHNNLVNCTGRDNDLGNVSGCGDGNGCHQNYLP